MSTFSIKDFLKTNVDPTTVFSDFEPVFFAWKDKIKYDQNLEYNWLTFLDVSKPVFQQDGNITRLLTNLYAGIALYQSKGYKMDYTVSTMLAACLGVNPDVSAADFNNSARPRDKIIIPNIDFVSLDKQLKDKFTMLLFRAKDANTISIMSYDNVHPYFYDDKVLRSPWGIQKCMYYDYALPLFNTVHILAILPSLMTVVDSPLYINTLRLLSNCPNLRRLIAPLYDSPMLSSVDVEKIFKLCLIDIRQDTLLVKAYPVGIAKLLIIIYNSYLKALSSVTDTDSDTYIKYAPSLKYLVSFAQSFDELRRLGDETDVIAYFMTVLNNTLLNKGEGTPIPVVAFATELRFNVRPEGFAYNLSLQNNTYFSHLRTIRNPYTEVDLNIRTGYTGHNPLLFDRVNGSAVVKFCSSGSNSDPILIRADTSIEVTLNFDSKDVCPQFNFFGVNNDTIITLKTGFVDFSMKYDEFKNLVFIPFRHDDGKTGNGRIAVVNLTTLVVVNVLKINYDLSGIALFKITGLDVGYDCIVLKPKLAMLTTVINPTTDEYSMTISQDLSTPTLFRKESIFKEILTCANCAIGGGYYLIDKPVVEPELIGFLSADTGYKKRIRDLNLRDKDFVKAKDYYDIVDTAMIECDTLETFLMSLLRHVSISGRPELAQLVYSKDSKIEVTQLTTPTTTFFVPTLTDTKSYYIRSKNEADFQHACQRVIDGIPLITEYKRPDVFQNVNAIYLRRYVGGREWDDLAYVNKPINAFFNSEVTWPSKLEALLATVRLRGITTGCILFANMLSRSTVNANNSFTVTPSIEPKDDSKGKQFIVQINALIRTSYLYNVFKQSRTLPSNDYYRRAGFTTYFDGEKTDTLVGFETLEVVKITSAELTPNFVTFTPLYSLFINNYITSTTPAKSDVQKFVAFVKLLNI